MSRNNSRTTDITAAAIEWVHRLEATPGYEIEDEFEAWARKSPLHLSEFLKQQKIELGMRQIQKERAAARIAEAAAREQRAASLSPTRAANMRSRSNWKAWAVSGAVLALTVPPLVGVWLWQNTTPELHSTRSVGANVVLSDGTRVSLYPETLLSARVLGRFSEVTLDRGGAHFRVTHRLLRRFQVQAGEALFTATGTAFNVLRTSSYTGVYVEEGSVEVDGRLERATLTAGQSADVSADGRITSLLRAKHASSPGNGDFENVTLETLATEVNRRNQSPRIVVEGAARQRKFLRVDGITGPEELIGTLSHYPDLEIERRGHLVTIRKVVQHPY